MIVDAHTHVVPDRLPPPFDDDPRWPTISIEGDRAAVSVGNRLFRTIIRPSWDPVARLEEMDRGHVDVHVVSPMPELLAYWSKGLSGSANCSYINRWVASFVGADHRRFLGLGIVPLQELKRAVEQLDEIVELGLKGVLIGSNVNGVPASDPSFDPFYERLAGLGLAGFIHAFQPCKSTSFTPRLANAVTFPWEIGYVTSSLIARGGMRHIPGLRLAVSHGGGGALPALGRMMNAWDTFDEVRDAVVPHPREGARSLFYDAVVFDPNVLDFMIRTVGARQVMIGSDFPFMRHDPTAVLGGLELSSDDVAALQRGTAERWLGLDTPP